MTLRRLLASIAGVASVLALAAGTVGADATVVVQQAPASPPVNTALPVVSGTAQVGQTLTASTGSWTGKRPIKYAYQWERCDSGGAACGAIVGATGSSYLVAGGDAGVTLRVAVTASNSAGSATATSAATAVVQQVPASPPVNTALPVVSGTAQVGQTLTASTGSWGGTQPLSYAYQWQRCDSGGAACGAIVGATGSSYLVAGGDAGVTLRVAVTASNSAGSATATSAATAVVQASSSQGGLFSDGFESGDFSMWSPVQTAGDGTAVVESTLVRTGAYAAQLSESSTSGSKAFVRKTFASAQQDVTVSGDFDVLQEGASGGNVPFFRFLDPTSTRVVSVYRQNATGAVGLGYGGANFSTGVKLALNTWATVALHVITNGTSSTVQLSLNGMLIYQTASASLGTAGVATIQIGNDTAAQMFTLVADTISAQASSTVVSPVNTALPVVSGTAQVGQTLTASTGSWGGTQPLSYAYQWQRCDSGGAACGAIVGATGSSYLVAGGDAGVTLRVAVTASNSAGSATATSAATAVVQQSGGTPRGQVALWHMDETSGTVMSDSVGSHNGTLFNVQSGLPGFSGFAYGFNGSSSYVSVPSADDLNPGSADITITIHIKTTGTPPPPPADWDLIRKGLYTTTGGEYKMEFQQSGQASCGFEGSAGYSELIAGPALNDGQWHTIQCIKTSTAIELVADGQTFSQAANVGSIGNTSPVVIGARPGSDWAQASLDEASIQIG